jgi:hypothetical protein
VQCNPGECTRWCDEFQVFGDICNHVLALSWSELSAIGIRIGPLGQFHLGVQYYPVVKTLTVFVDITLYI